MLNKNVADYTNFEGKTNKRIVQAPGGASSLTLAWSNQKTDYGPQRKGNNNRIGNANKPNSSKNYGYNELGGNVNNDYGYGSAIGYSPYQQPSIGQGSYNYPPKQLSQLDNNQLGGYYGYKPYTDSNPSHYMAGYSGQPAMGSGNIYDGQLKNYYSYPKYSAYTPTNSSTTGGGSSNDYLMEQINSINYGIRPHNNHNSNNNSSNNNGYGYSSGHYNSYSNHNEQATRNYPSSGVYRTGPQVEQLEMAVKQYTKPKSSSQQQPAEYQYRPSVKVLGPPPQQYSIGNPDYNFWKDNGTDRVGHRQVQSEKRIGQREREREQQVERHVERTSVKVNNPPGGRQSLVLG